MSILAAAKKVSEHANAFVEENESMGRLHDEVVKAMQQSELPQMLKPDSNYSIREFIEVCGTLGEGCMSACLLYTSPSPRDRTRSRMPSSA